MRQGRAAAAWAALNERQRHYLTAIYHADQARRRERGPHRVLAAVDLRR
jgi:hypothetical protein